MPYNQLDEYAGRKDVLFEWDARGWSKRRFLPNSREAESNLLCSMVLSMDAREAVRYLEPEELFFEPARRTIFTGLRNGCPLWKGFEAAADYFRDQGTLEEVGGEIELERIWKLFPRHAELCAANYPYYIQILQDCHLRREAIRETLAFQSALFDGRIELEESVRKHVAKIHRNFRKPLGIGTG